MVSNGSKICCPQKGGVLKEGFVYNINMKKVRTKNKKGAFIAKRSDTKVGTIEKKYGVDLGVRPDMKLGTYLKKKGYGSLSDMLSR